ncbi:DUF1616 domain-containing protein [Natronorarus salvus]|uniref:DUF1616 domain-containing protein n=1 Tax=Natronorarus salvus TaxID=3117733 RepID=UPI002F26340E
MSGSREEREPNRLPTGAVSGVAGRVPRDIPVLGLLLAAGNGAVLAGLDPLSVWFGLVLALVLPGYALLTLVAPRGREAGGLGHAERLALSFATSLAVVPMLVLVLTVAVAAPLTTTTVLYAIDAFVLAALLAGLLRRLRLPREECYDLPVGRWLRGATDGLAAARENPLSVLLVLSMLLAVTTLGFAVAVPNDGERFTEFYLLTDGPDGPVAGEYPAELVEGEPETLLLGVENHERRPLGYEVDVEIQRVESDGGEVTVLERERLAELRLVLSHGESTTIEHDVAPEMTGERLRLYYTLSIEGSDEPYRELYLWVDVVPEGDGSDGEG